MAAQHRKLRETLEELRAELDAETGLDSRLRARLEGVVAELETALDAAAPGHPPGTEAAPLTQRLSETARHFEATHPDLAGAVGRVIDALAALGI